MVYNKIHVAFGALRKITGPSLDMFVSLATMIALFKGGGKP